METESKSKSAAGAVTATAKKSAAKDIGHRFEMNQAENGWTLRHTMPHKADDYSYTQPTEHVFSGDKSFTEMCDKACELAGMGKAPGNKNDKSGKMPAADKAGENDDQDDDE